LIIKLSIFRIKKRKGGVGEVYKKRSSPFFGAELEGKEGGRKERREKETIPFSSFFLFFLEARGKGRGEGFRRVRVFLL